MKPQGRTLEEFKPLGPGEQKLLEACRNGAVAVLGEAVPESITDGRRVRAAFLRFLLLGGDEQAPVHERGVRLQGAFVDGLLDLAGCRIPTNVSLTRCRFDGQFHASDAQVDGLLHLQASHLVHGLQADRVRCSAGIFLRHGFKATGPVRLLGAQIGGNLDCIGGQFEVEEGDALSADGATVKGDVFLSDGFKTTGKVRLLGAQIGGVLSCVGGRFEVKVGDAMSADRAEVKGSVFLKNGFKATGKVRLLGIQIGGDLSCTGGQFEIEKGVALSADGATVKGNVFLSDGFKATGEVRLLGAQIGGVLSCIGGQCAVTTGDAMSADRAEVKGSVFLKGGFKATGKVRLLGMQIGGDLNCLGGQIEVEAGDALSADGVIVKGDVFLGDGFKTTGKVRLLGAQIGGTLACVGGRFEVKAGDALSADRADIKGSVFLKDGFKATGEVRLLGARIGANLDCTGGHFEVDKGDAISADRIDVKGSVFLSEGFKATGVVKFTGANIGGNLACLGGRFAGRVGPALFLGSGVVRGVWHLYDLPQAVRVDASHAEVAVLIDDLAAWAPGSVLNGFRYDSLGGRAPTRGADRLAWLCRQGPSYLGDTDGGAHFRPQPWRQLQHVLREMGHTEEAKQIGIAFEDRLRAIGRLGQSPPDTPAPFAWLKRQVAWLSHRAFGALAGYGYRPIRLVAWMASVWLLCGLAYWWLALPPRSAMAPSDPLVFQNPAYAECLPDRPQAPGNWFLCGPLRGEYATFSPLAFSLDVLLPVVDLGQEKTWGAFVPTPRQGPVDELLGHWHWGHVARLLVWFEILFGWLSSLLLVAIVSGFSRRSDEG